MEAIPTSQVYFEGTVGTGGVVSVTLSEDNQLVFENAWAGMVMDLGAGAYPFCRFNQDVTTAFPGSPTTVSGSFILNKQ